MGFGNEFLFLSEGKKLHVGGSECVVRKRSPVLVLHVCSFEAVSFLKHNDLRAFFVFGEPRKKHTSRLEKTTGSECFVSLWET